jgi:two-component system sensor histidine kinase/response regulator
MRPAHDPTVPPPHVLLAEDNEINQKLATRLLERRGYRVTIASNGALAVKAHALGEFDIILMDVQMPELDGLEATQVIRASEAATKRHTPIIALTAHAMTGDRDRCLRAGMDAYVTKPLSQSELFGTIEALIGSRSPRP